MKALRLPGLVINMDAIAWATRPDDNTVVLHFAVPRAITIPGVAVASNSPRPAASDHCTLQLDGADAEYVWRELNAT